MGYFKNSREYLDKHEAVFQLSYQNPRWTETYQ